MEQRRALREAIAAIEAGDKLKGRQLLSQILRSDPGLAEAWLWMSRVAESDSQRQECLRRALSPTQPGAPVSRAATGLAQPSEDASSPAPTRAGLLFPGTPANREDSAGSVLTTRRLLRASLPSLTDAQRQIGQRNVMLAGAMTFSLLCGLALLVFVVLTKVPTARERMRERYVSMPYQAVLWCQSCEQSGEPIILRDRPGRLLSHEVTTLDHGTTVTVVAEEWVRLEGCVYVEVQAATESGWVRSTYVSSRQKP